MIIFAIKIKYRLIGHISGCFNNLSKSLSATYSHQNSNDAAYFEGSLSGGKQTDEPGPFDTRPFKHVQGPFSSHTGNQYKGSNYQVDAASSLGGHNFAAVGYSGK